MSIKKIPICPFCKSEMKEEGYGQEAKIPTKLEERNVPRDPNHVDVLLPNQIAEYSSLTMYICQNCRFVAFWRGEL